jgi:predicted DNA-binding protein with PD1-like motif
MVIHVLRLQPGADLKGSLEDFTQTNGMQAGFILTAVGSLKQATIRYAGQSDIDVLNGDFEIVSLVGTLSPNGAHLHVSISDSQGRTIGGHLSRGSIIRTTAEIVIGESSHHRFSRTLDHQTGYLELQIEEI